LIERRTLEYPFDELDEEDLVYEYDLLVVGVIAILPVLVILFPSLLIWMRVFVISNMRYFPIMLFFMLSIAILHFMYSGGRENIYSSGSGVYPFIATRRQYESRVEFADEFENELKSLVFYNSAIKFMSFILLGFDGYRFWRCSGITGLVAVPIFIIVLRIEESTSWILTIVLAVLFSFIAVPLLWRLMVILSIIIGTIFVDLFTPSSLKIRVLYDRW